MGDVERFVQPTPSALASEVIGTDRIMCATDYPFPPVEPQGNRRFLEASGLSRGEMKRIASGTWEQLRSGILR